MASSRDADVYSAVMHLGLAAALVLALGACATSDLGVDADPSDSSVGADAADAAPMVDARPPIDAVPLPDACETGTVESCASCGDVCPGVGATNAAPACESLTCVFRCAGESYDVNGSIADGCEETDSPTGNHLAGGAIDLGSFPCDDGSSNPNISGLLLSDAREHTPSIAGFQSTTGSAPDFFKLYADGGLCVNDLNVTLNVTGSSSPTCYRLTVDTSAGPYTCQANSSGTCSISNGSGSYADNTNMLFRIEKTCPTSVTERVSYTVTGHL